MSKLFLLLSLSCLFVTILFSQEEKNQITSMTNTGIMIEYQGKKAMIDTLHQDNNGLLYYCSST